LLCEGCTELYCTVPNCANCQRHLASELGKFGTQGRGEGSGCGWSVSHLLPAVPAEGAP